MSIAQCDVISCYLDLKTGEYTKKNKKEYMYVKLCYSMKFHFVKRQQLGLVAAIYKNSSRKICETFLLLEI